MARPPTLFEDQPTIIIFDLNHYITNRLRDLKPFHDIAFIINNENHLYHELDRLNKVFITIAILPQWNHAQAQTLVQQNLLQYPSVAHLCLFFINGQESDMRPICGTRLIGCYSITSNITAQTRNACAKANDLHIEYCEYHQQQNEVRGDIGVANVYAIEKLRRVDLQAAFNEQLEREFEEELFD